MSRFESFIKGLTDPVSPDRGGVESAHDRRRDLFHDRRRRFNSPDVVEKQGEINRRAEVNADIRSVVKESGAAPKPYDSTFLRDISANAIVQAYIDTLSQDVATANWQFVARDEGADVPDEVLARAERRYETLFPEQTPEDAHEATTRVLLELGDSVWVKHFDDGGRFREAIPVDSATFFKKVDKFGITEGYVQASRSTKSIETEFKKREVVWFEWSNRPDRFYGQGPLEKAQNEVELLEELAEKERLDLLQGSPPGVLSPAVIDEFGGLPDTDDWDNFVEEFRLDEGERHRVGYSNIPVDFTQLTPNYQELQILDRSKFWVTVLGSVFKVNPSYAGFDFENVNRATDESQQEAYAQRGFRVTLRQIEEAINRNLIWPEFSKDIKFEFEREQTVAEKKTRAELVESQATAGKEMANAGVPTSYRDGMLVVDDGPIEEGNVGDTGGGGGGLFGSVDDRRDAELEVRELKKAHDGDGVRLVFPPGGEGHSDLVEWHGFLEDVVQAGGRIVDVSGFEQRVFPPDPPESHDPRMIVYGLSESDVLAILDRYPNVDLQIDTDRNAEKRLGLSKDEFETLEKAIDAAWRSQIEPETVADIEKAAWEGDQSVPDSVVDAINQAIDAGAVFENFDSIPSNVVGRVEDLLRENLTQPQGWSLDSIVDDFSDAFPGVDEDELEVVARTETASVLNTSYEEAILDRDADAVFYWQGPDDSRTTAACEDMKIATGQASGTIDAPISNPPGRPVPLDQLIELERIVSNHHFPDLSFRRHVLHPNERHRFVRDVAASTGIDVDVPGAEAFGD